MEQAARKLAETSFCLQVKSAELNAPGVLQDGAVAQEAPAGRRPVRTGSRYAVR